MADIYPVPAEWAERTRVDAAGYEAMYADARDDADAFWIDQAQRLDWITPPSQAGDWSFDQARLPHPLVRRRRAQRQRQLPRPSPGRAGRRDRADLGARRPRRGAPPLHLPRTPRGGLPLRQRAQGGRGAEGRPRHPLHADDPRGRLRAARLRPDRRDPLGGVRRLLARSTRRPDRGLRQPRRHHRRRRPPRRQADAAKGQRRRRRRTRRRLGARDRRARDRRRGADAPARPPLRPARRRSLDRLPARADGVPRTRCSSSTRPARPANPRACSTPPPAICSGRRGHTNSASITAPATSGGAPPMSAG